MKLIATDMDGTLLNREQRISEENKYTLLKAKEQGIEVAIATGRVFYDVQRILQEADLTAHIIGTNGATVHTEQGQQLYSAALEMMIL